MTRENRKSPAALAREAYTREVQAEIDRLMTVHRYSRAEALQAAIQTIARRRKQTPTRPMRTIGELLPAVLPSPKPKP